MYIKLKRTEKCWFVNKTKNKEITSTLLVLMALSSESFLSHCCWNNTHTLV